MYKVEYLITILKSKIKLKDFVRVVLQNDLIVQKDKNKVIYKSFEIEYSFKSNIIENTEDTYVHLTLSCSAEDKLDDFSSFLEILKTNFILYPHREIWNGLSMYYSHKAYPYISTIENLMRKVIIKFMVAKIGFKWSKGTIPDEVSNQVKKRNGNIDKIYDYDFMHLYDFLFKDNYPGKEQELITKLKEAQKGTLILDYDEIISLVPTSNWTKYFSKIITCSPEYLQSTWTELNAKRNSIAHNKLFTKVDLDRIVKLCNDLTFYLEAGVKAIDKLSVSEKEQEGFLREELMEEWYELDANISRYSSERNYNKGYHQALYYTEGLNIELEFLAKDPISNATRITQIEKDLAYNRKVIKAGEDTLKWYEEEIAIMQKRFDELSFLLNLTGDQTNPTGNNSNS